MNKKEFVSILDVISSHIENGDEEIINIMTDSREKMFKSVFLAVKGNRFDSNDFIEQAIDNGAILVITQKKPQLKCDYILVEDVRKIQNRIASKIYNIPFENINIIGITGTNGKTSSTYIFQSILQNMDYKCARAGTIDVDTGVRKYNSLNTFPEGPVFLRYIKEAYDNGLKYFVCEVSSHALALGRTDEMEFSYGIFTNLTRDHLDFHTDMEDYYQSKRKLFEKILEKGNNNGFSVNVDCKYGKRLYEEFKEKLKIITFGYNKNCDLQITGLEEKKEESLMSFMYKGKKHKITYPLSGEFNALNVAGCISILLLMSINIDKIKKACGNISKIPGRLEKVTFRDKNIFVDYAHTPDALERVLLSLRKIYNKVILVFGCGGNRDKGKRSIMGSVASANADFSIVTNDNPRYEDEKEIIFDILKGFNKKNYKIVYNREKAIIEALNMVEINECVLIAGKGHEEYQEINGIKSYFSDRGVIEKYENTI